MGLLRVRIRNILQHCVIVWNLRGCHLVPCSRSQITLGRGTSREEMHVTDHRAMSTCPSSPVPDLNLSTHCSVSTESTCKDTKLMMRINWPLVWQYLRTRRLIWRWQRMMMIGRRDRLLEMWLDKDMDWLEGLSPRYSWTWIMFRLSLSFFLAFYINVSVCLFCRLCNARRTSTYNPILCVVDNCRGWHIPTNLSPSPSWYMEYLRV